MLIFHPFVFILSKKPFTPYPKIDNSPQNLELPHDLEAERALLGSILVSGSHSREVLDDLVGILKTEYFFDLNHQKVFAAMLVLWNQGMEIDTVHLVSQIQKDNKDNAENLDQKYILTLAAKSSLLASTKNAAKTIKEKYLLRSVISVGEEIKQMGFDDQETASNILDKAQKRLYEASLDNLDKYFVKISDLLGPNFDTMSMLSENEDVGRGIKTGLVDMDKILGGFQNSDLIILAARPSMGKTALSLEITRRIAKAGTGVAFFSLEMSAEQICERLLSRVSEIDFGKIRRGELSEDKKNEGFAKIGEAIGNLAEYPIWIDDSASLNILELRSKARRLKARQNIGLIIVDYLQLMSGKNERAYQGNRTQEVSDISRSLKILAKELNVPIIALSQLSRSVESRDDKRPMLSDLRESGSIEQDADIVLFIYRDAFYNRDKYAKMDEKERREKENIAEILNSKHRNGATGMVQMAWVKHLASFDNLLGAKIMHGFDK